MSAPRGTARKSMNCQKCVPAAAATNGNASGTFVVPPVTTKKSARKSIRNPSRSVARNDDSLEQTQPLQIPERITRSRVQPSSSLNESDDSTLDSSTSSQPSTSKGVAPVNRRLLLTTSDSDTSDSEDIGHVSKKQNKGRTPIEESSDEDFNLDTDVGLVNRKRNPRSISTEEASEDDDDISLQSKRNKICKKFRTAGEVSSTSVIIQKAKQQSSSGIKKTQDFSDQPLSGKCVSYILVADRKKTAIKKSDILKHCFESSNKKLFDSVFHEVQNILNKSFGLVLIELADKKNEYILSNGLDKNLKPQKFAKYSSYERKGQGFVFYLLTMIFMSGNTLEESKLDKYLEPLGIKYASKTNSVFGDVKKLVTDTLVKKMYVVRKLVTKDPEAYELSWGPRAFKEVLKRDCLDLACTLMDDTKPEDWPVQYKEVEEESQDS